MSALMNIQLEKSMYLHLEHSLECYEEMRTDGRS